ncbi:MAG: hypothetical protein QOI66_2775 [Myxococcales bacterium]|jgi:hypothetical protein|nr:hypothetical protein [Myxococcales bacterium]
MVTVRVTRLLDLIVIVLLAAVLLMPRPDVTVKAALRLPTERRERVAELQAALLGKDDSLPEAIELADIYLDGHRPDWALATVGAVLPLHQDDYRLHHIRAVAFADRFESAPAFEAAKRALALCERPAPAVPACGEAARSRLHLLNATLASVAGVDMRNNPALAKEKIMEQLRPTFIPKRPKPAATTPTPIAPTPAAPKR